MLTIFASDEYIKQMPKFYIALYWLKSFEYCAWENDVDKFLVRIFVCMFTANSCYCLSSQGHGSVAKMYIQPIWKQFWDIVNNTFSPVRSNTVAHWWLLVTEHCPWGWGGDCMACFSAENGNWNRAVDDIVFHLNYTHSVYSQYSMYFEYCTFMFCLEGRFFSYEKLTMKCGLNLKSNYYMSLWYKTLKML